VAHELAHALAPSVPHGTGLTSASLTDRQLTASSIPFETDRAPTLRGIREHIVAAATSEG